MGISDETPRAWSAVYFFFHPDYAHCSLGTANVVKQVELARERGIPHVYLGYRVLGCASLKYKGGFRPHDCSRAAPRRSKPPSGSPAPER